MSAFGSVTVHVPVVVVLPPSFPRVGVLPLLLPLPPVPELDPEPPPELELVPPSAAPLPKPPGAALEHEAPPTEAAAAQERDPRIQKRAREARERGPR
jgi:hypothetical protein